MSCFPQGTKQIFVTVLDVNDNYPQFENSPYDVNVSEVSRREVTIFFRFNRFRNVASFYIKSIFFVRLFESQNERRNSNLRLILQQLQLI